MEHTINFSFRIKYAKLQAKVLKAKFGVSESKDVTCDALIVTHKNKRKT